MMRLLASILLSAALAACAASAQDRGAAPLRVLLTNDDGIVEPRLATLAQAFARAGAEVWVVAADADRSGASNLTPAARAGRFAVRRVDLGPRVTAYELQGAPADCVLFALTGPMRERPPDLVVSGPNGGDNAGDDWFGSGTIGAARTAAYLGLPAIAVSGFAMHDGEDERIAADWIVSLAFHPVARSLEPQHYLTVSFPETPLAEVRGVEITRRAQRLLDGEAELRGAYGGWEHWALTLREQTPPPDTDVAALTRGNIAIVVMQVGDVDDDSRRDRRHAPTWPSRASSQ